MIRRIVLLVLAACLLQPLRPAQAQENAVVIKLATFAPVGSIWHTLLKEAAQRIQELSAGKVKMKIFAGGTMGNEGDVIKKIRIGQLQAAAVTTIGVHEITPEPMTLDLPLFVRDTSEKEYLLGKLQATMEEAMEKKGYKVLNWSEIGFVRFFSTKERPTLAKMREGKLFSWDGDPASTDAWKKAGFHPVVLSSTDIIPSLQTGMIDTIAYPPTAALAVRVHDKAKFMMDPILSSLTGLMIIDKKTWEKIPKDLQPKILEVTKELGRRTIESARKMEEESLTKMKAQGLKIVKVEDYPEWVKAVEETYPVIRGKVVPAALFDQAQRLMKEYRAGKAQK